MADLEAARKLFGSLCYGGDFVEFSAAGSTQDLRKFRASGVEALAEIVPTLAKSLAAVCERLGIPPSCVRLFVFPNSKLQAQCAFINYEQCAVRVSSSMVERFADQEMCFVVGHELGHFLLGNQPDEATWNLQAAQASRAREISCDRVGLIACGDIHWALRAMMKTASGLSDEFLRFDAASFMARALSRHSENADPSIAYASHPPLALRTRALFWFEEYRVKYFPQVDSISVAAFKKLDARVARDKEKYVECEVYRLESEAALELKKWIWTATAISKQRFDAKSQAVITREFGENFCTKVKDMLASLSGESAFAWVSDNAASAYGTFRSMFPRRASSEANIALTKSEKAILGPEDKCFLRSREWTKVRG